MKILEKHILSEFLKLLAITTVSLVSLFILVDVIEKVDDMIEHNVPAAEGVMFFLYKLPALMGQVSPIAILLSVLLSLGLLNRHGEITAIKAGGISLMRALSPLVATGLVASFLVIIVNETITPTTNRLAASFENKWFRGLKAITFGSTGLWIKGADGIYNIRKVDLDSGELRGLTYYNLTRSVLQSRTHARVVRWSGSEWIADKGTVWSFNERGLGGMETTDDLVIDGLRGPGELMAVENDYASLNFNELSIYIKGLEADGYDTTKYRVDLYSKITFPMVNLIMVLVGIPFALKTGRHGGIAVGVGLSVIIGFSYWVVFGITSSLGYSGMLPPLVAAVFPDILFLATAAVIFGYVRQ